MLAWQMESKRLLPMKTIRSFVCVSLIASAWSVALAQPPDEVQIRAIATSWQSAWNAHDMKALFTLVTPDADFVNVGGKHWKGREQIEAEHTLRLSQFQESTWTTKSVTVQLLKPDIALVHVNWSIVGDKDPDGTARKPREDLFTWIVTKHGGQWQIRAAQNTNINNAPPPELRK
jgi:uncharacterized protein (TIGR02246 family)